MESVDELFHSLRARCFLLTVCWMEVFLTIAEVTGKAALHLNCHFALLKTQLVEEQRGNSGEVQPRQRAQR
jgi:hypothetical protein